MKSKRVEIVEIETNIPNAIILDGKLLQEMMDRKERIHLSWKIHFFFIGLVLGFLLSNLI